MSLTKTEVSQLYVSIFGRASEGEGSQYWQKQSSMKNAADEMLNTSAAKSYFGDTLNDNQSFIEFIYENTLNKTIEDDPAGIEFWTKQLNDGKSKGEVVSSLIKAINTYAPGAENYDSTNQATVDAYNQFDNRVEISNYMADTVYYTPDDYETSTSFKHDLNVSSDSTKQSDFRSYIDQMASSKPKEAYKEELSGGEIIGNIDINTIADDYGTIFFYENISLEVLISYIEMHDNSWHSYAYAEGNVWNSIEDLGYEGGWTSTTTINDTKFKSESGYANDYTSSIDKIDFTEFSEEDSLLYLQGNIENGFDGPITGNYDLIFGW